MLNLSWYLWCQSNIASGSVWWVQLAPYAFISHLVSKKGSCRCGGDYPLSTSARRSCRGLWAWLHQALNLFLPGWRQDNKRASFRTDFEQGSPCPKAAGCWGQFEVLTRAVRERGAWALQPWLQLHAWPPPALSSHLQAVPSLWRKTMVVASCSCHAR